MCALFNTEIRRLWVNGCLVQPYQDTGVKGRRSPLGLGAGSLGVSQTVLIQTLRAGSAAVSADIAKLNSA